MVSNVTGVEEHKERYRVARMRASHLPEATEIVRRALPHSLAAELGPGFLRELLASYATMPRGHAFVSLHRGRVAGLVAGTEDSVFHRHLLLKRRLFPLATRAAWGLMSSPRTLLRLFKYLRPSMPARRTAALRDNGQHGEEPVPAASLVLLAVDPDHQRRGIGDQLSEAFLEGLSARGVESVKLAVGVENEQAVSFYLSRGWRRAGRYATPEGGSIYRMVRSTLVPAERRRSGLGRTPADAAGRLSSG
jgi:ribosomal protein S18 acetylase RimI-like enzyme